MNLIFEVQASENGVQFHIFGRFFAYMRNRTIMVEQVVRTISTCQNSYMIFSLLFENLF